MSSERGIVPQGEREPALVAGGSRPILETGAASGACGVLVTLASGGTQHEETDSAAQAGPPISGKGLVGSADRKFL